MGLDRDSSGVEITYRIRLAWALAGYLDRLNYTVTHLVIPNPISLPSPPVKGDYAPDLIARNPEDQFAIGLAVESAGVENAETRTKLIDFACRYDRRTKLPVEFFIAVPDNDDIVFEIKSFYKEQQVDKRKTNIRIVRLNIGEELQPDLTSTTSAEPTPD